MLPNELLLSIFHPLLARPLLDAVGFRVDFLSLSDPRLMRWTSISEGLPFSITAPFPLLYSLLF
jgi:hypothetical protein